jgi:hypothetical protein
MHAPTNLKKHCVVLIHKVSCFLVVSSLKVKINGLSFSLPGTSKFTPTNVIREKARESPQFITNTSHPDWIDSAKLLFATNGNQLNSAKCLNHHPTGLAFFSGFPLPSSPVFSPLAGRGTRE